MDDKYFQFLDNIVKGSSNEELMRMEQQPPIPMRIEKQTPTVIEGSAKVNPIELPDGVNLKSDQNKIRLKIHNDALAPIQKTVEDLSHNYEDINNEVGSYKNDMISNLDKLNSTAGQQFRVDPDLQNQINRADKNLGSAQVPERDMLSQAILSFAPALFGAVTGESGAISQVQGGEKGRSIYENIRKGEIENANNKNSMAQKRYEQLVKIKNSGQEAFTKAQQLEMDRLKTLISGTGDLLKTGVADQKNTESNIIKQKEALAKGVAEGGEKIAGGIEKEISEENRIKAAKISAQNQSQKLNIPTEGERKGSFLYGNIAQAEQNMDDLLNQTGGKYPSLTDKFYRTQRDIVSGQYGGVTMTDFLNNKNIDPKVRQQAQIELSFLEGIGRIQSGAAISPKEWLNFREQYYPTYGDNTESIAQKSQQRKTSMKGIEVIAGRALKDAAKPVQVINPSSQQTMIKDGVQYIKIQGGWKKVENAK